jgi:Mg-chelatase subunit ChlD
MNRDERLPAVVPTSAVTFVETEHGRLRRRQRGIDKKDLQAARKHGTRQSTHPRPNGDQTAKYTHNDITYIVNENTGEEVTTYATPVELDPVPITTESILQHKRAAERIKRDLNSWTSNVVLVVDTSGSMKTADVWGTRNRLKAVWLSIALDFVASRLEKGEGGLTDVVSIVTLHEASRVVVHEEPCSWVLYNKLVRIYKDDLVPPSGHGPFLPGLEKAEALLMRNNNAACAMGLTFLSDGRPSDVFINKGTTKEDNYARIEKKIEDLARIVGRRLTFKAIGIGDYQDFEMLQRMVDAANDFGARAEFCLPSMTSSALGDVFSSVATSVSSTQMELTDTSTMKQRKVRNVLRESRKKAGQTIEKVSNADFWIYSELKSRRSVYKESTEGTVRKKWYETTPLQHPNAKFVAFAKGPFGEGAERYAFRLYELASDASTIVGQPLVAKESRLILDSGGSDEQARKKFVKTFCSTQQLAGRLAEKFNDRLDETLRVDSKTPKIRFLDCSIYELSDQNLGKLSVLVEEKLDHDKWQKWNSNNGYVEGMKHAPTYSVNSLREAMLNMIQVDQIDVIEEGSEEDDESDDEDVGGNSKDTTKKPKVVFTPFEVAQAFSHYSYYASWKKRLVCDLQGVYDEDKNVLMFSDPVIHYHSEGSTSRRNVHGNTDHGKKGMAKFFDTHHEHCGHLCKLVNRGFHRSGRKHGHR